MSQMTAPERLVLALQLAIEHAATAQEQVRRYGAVDENTLVDIESSLQALREGAGETGEAMAGIGCGCIAPWEMDSTRRPDPRCARCGGSGELKLKVISSRDDSGLIIVGTGHVHGRSGPCGGVARAYDAMGCALIHPR